VSGEAARLLGLADRAATDVRQVLPGWRGPLVVEVPPRHLGLAAVLGGAPGDYDRLAAVTTTADASLSRSAPAHVFVNQRVFRVLGPRAAQAVMSHEATHVATHAAVSAMPSWLLEGFADYVALRRAGVPATVLAGQALGRVRRGGPPRHLPGRRDFEARNAAVGAAYEEAWLACRLFARRYGENRLVRLYRAADRTSSAARGFMEVGVRERAFTSAWRQQLRRLAR
jgi:hypothetical protein